MIEQYRAEFDAEVSFLNGGGLSAHGFRVDVPGPAVDAAEVARLFVASLSLLMVEEVRVTRLHVLAEPHKGTRGGPSDRPAHAGSGGAVVELSHPFGHGTTTYPGLPAPEITPYLTREASRESYAPGTEFTIDRMTLVGNTGTYLDAPFHRYADGADLADLPASAFTDLDAVVVRLPGTRSVGPAALAALDVAGRAVLLHTGGDRRWGTPAYAVDAPHLTRGGAEHLAERGAALVGIDAVNIDDTDDPARPAHTVLLAAGIPIVEHLTGLEQLPPTGARFTAAPARVVGFGTFPVRAVAVLPGRP